MNSELSYAGVLLIVPKPDLLADLQADLPLDCVYDFQARAWPGKGLTGIAFPGLTRQRPVELQRLWWPTGAARWAVGYFLASESRLAQIRSQVYPGGTGYQAQPLVMTAARPDGTSLGSLTTSLWLLPPRPIKQIENRNGYYLLTLVDDRYFWWQTPAALSITPGSLTWSGLYALLGVALGVTITADAVAAAYLTPAAVLAGQYESLPLLLDAVACNCGQRIVRKLDGTVYAYNVTTSQTKLQANVAAVDALENQPRAGGVMGIQAVLA